MGREKNYKLENNGLTVLMNNTYDKYGKFEFKGLIVADKPNTIFKSSVSSLDKTPDGIEFISIRTYLFNMIKNKADKELKEYIDANINNFDFYTEQIPMNEQEYDGKFVFFTNHIYFEESEYYKNQNMEMDLCEIAEGIVELNINSCDITFDFRLNEFTKITKGSHNDKRIVTPLEVFYSGMLHKILAFEQYKKGIAHKAFTEIINLGKFLEGKKSVKIILKNGRGTITLKERVSVNGLLTMFKGDFYINDSYQMEPRLNGRLPMIELDYLQYGKNIYKINIDNLIIE